MAMRKVLIIEDEASLRKVVTKNSKQKDIKSFAQEKARKE